MNQPLTIECAINFRRIRRADAKGLRVNKDVEGPGERSARVPRIARLMALAIRFDKLVRAGEIADYAALARLGRVSRARISQILNLLQLAPDLQERLLFLPGAERGRDPIHLAQVQPIAGLFDWRKQRCLWRERIGM